MHKHPERLSELCSRQPPCSEILYGKDFPSSNVQNTAETKSNQIAAAFTATIVAVTYLLCNVYEKEITTFFRTAKIPTQLIRHVDLSVAQVNPFVDQPFGINPLPIPGSSGNGNGGTGINPLPVPNPDGNGNSGINPLPVFSVSSSDASPTPTAITSESTPPSTPTPTTTSSSESTSSSSSSSPPPSTSVNPLPTSPADPTSSLPHSPGVDEYHLYTGNGSIAAGWPHKSDWMSYEDMFTSNLPLMTTSCAHYHVPPDTSSELSALHTATLSIAAETNTDPRFILAIILQESSGCVRVPTTYGAVRNPGLMQSHNGPATCNEDASPVYPCPAETIEEMIREGTAGHEGMGLVEALRSADKLVGAGGLGDVGRFYRAARVYNSGSVDGSGDLGLGGATRCYASDVANRLRGWVEAEDGCDG
ncbi:MAG: hypothetical protein Q9219_004105 [cf. Caloplaca sp. 3 TL-2023]